MLEMKQGWQTIVKEFRDGTTTTVESNTSRSTVSLLLAATRHGGDVLRPVGGGLGMRIYDDAGNKFYFE